VLNLSISSTEEKLKLYFQGELDRIISRLYKKINLQYNDDYYLTIGSIDTSRPHGGQTNSWSDPTGNRAAKLIDLKETVKEFYEKYKILRSIIQKIIINLSDEEVLILKTHLGLTEDSITALRRKIGFTQIAIKRKIISLLKTIDNKIIGGLINGSKKGIKEY